MASADNLTGKTIFGEYTITRKLGEGGMGAVYLASQQAIEQEIAIKVLHGRSSKSDELVKRFNREAKAASMLSHPNIIRVFIFGRTEDGLIYMAMEFVKGRSLHGVISREPMSEMRAIKILKQTLSALSEAHDVGIIHRDLKPENILLTTYRGQTDFVKVLDFGIAKIREPEGTPEQKLTQAGVVYGTPEYLSPEQAQALELDSRSDIYSLGCILYEMMTGQPPFKAATAVNMLMMHVHQAPTPPSQVAPRPISAEMEAVILKAMAKDPADRYQTAMAFFDALVEVEQALVRKGHSIHQIHVPGQELTQAMVMPDDLVAQARAATQGPATVPMSAADGAATFGGRAETPDARATLMVEPTSSGGNRTLMIVLIVLMLLLLGVGAALILVMAK